MQMRTISFAHGADEERRVHDHSWNSHWDVRQCNTRSYPRIRHTPAAHFTEPASSFPLLTLHTSFLHYFFPKGRNEAKTFCVKGKNSHNKEEGESYAVIFWKRFRFTIRSCLLTRSTSKHLLCISKACAVSAAHWSTDATLMFYGMNNRIIFLHCFIFFSCAWFLHFVWINVYLIMLPLRASGFVKYPEVTSTGKSPHSSQVMDLVIWDIFRFFFLVQGQVQSSINGTSPSCVCDPWLLSFRVHDVIQLTLWGDS